MNGLTTKADISLEDGVLVLRLPAFERSLRGLVRDVLQGNQVSLPNWMRNNLAPEDRLAVLELIDPPIRSIAVEAAKMKARSLPPGLNDQTFTDAMEAWVAVVLKDDSDESTDGPGDRLLWRVANEVREFTKDCHPDLEPAYKAGHEHLQKADRQKFWERCCKLVGFWVDECLDALWEDYMQRHDRTE